MRLTKALGYISFCLLIAACGHKHDGPSTHGGRVERRNEQDSCETFIKNLPAGTMHGWVESLEDPSDPKSPLLKIFYYGKIAKDEASPILFINGGPTYSSHGSQAVFSDSVRSAPAWASAPLIFFDQRGTGCSSHYPQGDSPEVLARLRFYGSRGIVADAEIIRKHLIGDRPWRIFGQSYGAWIVHRYVAVAPGSLTAAFAHANAITENPIERGALRIAAQNRVMKSYLEKYGEDAGILTVLRQALNPDKCFRDGPDTWEVCGFEVIEAFASDYLPFSNTWKAMHGWLAKMFKNGAMADDGVLEFLREEVYPFKPDPQNRTAWANRVIGRFDRNRLPSFNRQNCELMYAFLRQKGEQPENDLINECMTSLQFPEWSGAAQVEEKLARFEARYGSDPLTIDDVEKALRSHPALKFSLYSGQLDAAVPVELFPTEVSRLGSLIRYRHFPSSGHEGYRTEPQVAADVLE